MNVKVMTKKTFAHLFILFVCLFISLFTVHMQVMTIMRIPADHKSDVVFPSNSSSFNESFIQEEKGAITLSASLFNQGTVKLCYVQSYCGTVF